MHVYRIIIISLRYFPLDKVNYINYNQIHTKQGVVLEQKTQNRITNNIARASSPLMLSESQCREQNQEHEGNNSDKGCHHSPTNFLAEITKLVANGEPIGTGIAIVG